MILYYSKKCMMISEMDPPAITKVTPVSAILLTNFSANVSSPLI